MKPKILADALGCFWNAAIGAAHQRQSTTAMELAHVLVEGVSAVANRLNEHEDEHDRRVNDLLEANNLYLERARAAEARLKDIGDFAHDRSTGPTIPDDLWEIRRMAYDL